MTFSIHRGDLVNVGAGIWRTTARIPRPAVVTDSGVALAERPEVCDLTDEAGTWTYDGEGYLYVTLATRDEPFRVEAQ